MNILRNLVFGRRTHHPEITAGTNTTITKNGITETIAETAAATATTGWTDDGANVRLTTAGDTVSIGTASPAGSLKITVAGDVGPEADNTRSLGATALRWANGLFARILAGIASGASGVGIINATAESTIPHLFSEVANSSNLSMGTWLVRRYRGTLAAKTNVITGDGLCSIEIQPDPSGGVVQGATVLWDVESRTGATAIGVREGHYTRGNAAGAALTLRLQITANGNVVVGTQAAALATTAVDGFLHIPSCAGVPTGVPTLYTGCVPMVYDTTNLRLYVYAGGAWRIH